MRFESPAPRRRLIGLTPLIDVVFILLVFFMLASSLIKWQAVEMGEPASAGAETPVVGSWLVRVQPEELDLNAETIAAAELAGRVTARIGEDPAQRILVQPAPGVSLQRLVDVLDLLRDAGATHLTLLRL
ncbi:ExbD/TolR family protein [Thiocapsa marina]|uniref:Biopolymer transport protein ExbD/TolR n=1 Tax=Thiocapsa marina 5811 TaxID=768671 RepID=F9U788_9GAMM|nr:biopolymer transporter ExbD [Thiocapsa marina]EGV20114.1 Biopolymer transport protein ExbD/TolR [Thiocapsa marina 5811]